MGFVFCVPRSIPRRQYRGTSLRLLRPPRRPQASGVGVALIAEVAEQLRERGVTHRSASTCCIRTATARGGCTSGLASSPYETFMVAPLDDLGGDSNRADPAGVRGVDSTFRPTTRPAVESRGDAVHASDRPLRAHRGHGGEQRLGDRRRRALRSRPQCATTCRRRAVGADGNARDRARAGGGAPSCAISLFERGRMVDEYLSVPSYYGELSKADELSLSANATMCRRLTGAEPAQVRAVARIGFVAVGAPAGSRAPRADRERVRARD